jgi:periplasmic protein TonB
MGRAATAAHPAVPADGGVPTLEDLPLHRASPWITVPVTLAGYLVVAWTGWRLLNRTADPAGPPPTVTLELQAPGDGSGGPPRPAPPRPAPAAPRPAPAPAPPPLTAKATEVPVAAPPPPPQPEAAPDQTPTTLPTRDLSGTALPAGPGGGVPGGTGTGAGVPGGTGAGGGGGGGGPARVVDLDAGEMAVLSRPAFTYPPQARARHIQGTVRVEMLVGTDGVPSSVHAVDGPALLRQAAEAFAAKYRFRPEVRNGVPVLSHFFLNVVFQLN